MIKHTKFFTVTIFAVLLSNQQEEITELKKYPAPLPTKKLNNMPIKITNLKDLKLEILKMNSM